ncbi:MAG: MMPL family transporter, partial [Deltaproteobacteria bacterium]|nr:MMPL family transporter [Deltaproteobacteria bacterium]
MRLPAATDRDHASLVLRRFVERLARRLDRHRIAVVVASVVVALGCAWIGSHIRLASDLTNLLPAATRSVRDLEAVGARARAFGTLKIAIASDDPVQRGRVANALADRIAGFGPQLVAQVARDDGPQLRYGWRNRFLFADLADLRAAHDALRQRIGRANPLFVELDEDEDEAAAPDRLDGVLEKLAAAERAAAHPPPWVSANGHLQQITVQAPFTASDTVSGRALVARIDEAVAEALRDAPAVTVELAGNIAFNLHERDSMLDGMAASAAITVVLCAIALLLYYRSARLVAAMLWALATGVAATFAMALLVVGHLNVITAFLFAIIVGNGLNAGMILVARYLEELRAGADPHGAVAAAMVGALRGTFVASATAAIAYASLIVTDFRGFREFGLIAGIGMALTWLATFTVL